jgi:hypothetical protein
LVNMKYVVCKFENIIKKKVKNRMDILTVRVNQWIYPPFPPLFSLDSGNNFAVDFNLTANYWSAKVICMFFVNFCLFLWVVHHGRSGLGAQRALVYESTDSQSIILPGNEKLKACEITVFIYLLVSQLLLSRNKL